jgi:hypothetical protein
VIANERVKKMVLYTRRQKASHGIGPSPSLAVQSDLKRKTTLSGLILKLNGLDDLSLERIQF